MSKMDIYAHRGYTKDASDNSLKAFTDAMRTKATGIEFDLQLTSDRIAIVTHDLNMKKTIGQSILTTDMTLAAIRKKNKSILTFDELLEWAIPNQIPMNIELKESFINRIADLEIIVRKVQDLDQVHFSSFHLDVLQTVKKINPNAVVAYIPTKKFDWSTLVDLPYLNIIHANKHFYYKQKFFKHVENAGMSLRYYSVTGKETYLNDAPKVVIGWITDHPNEVYESAKK